MIVVETKLKNGTSEQYTRLDDPILTGLFIRNKCVRRWIENKGITRHDLPKLCSVLAKNISTPWVKKLNSQARKSSADRAWVVVSSFYQNYCEDKPGNLGYPSFKKYRRSGQEPLPTSLRVNQQ